MDKIAVLIPCYNESMTIQKVVTDFKMALPDAKIYVYDNNSSDNTALLASQAGAIVRHEPHPLDGNEAEDGEVYLYRYTEDADGNPDIQNIESDEEYEIVADAFDEFLDTAEYDEIVSEEDLDD